MNYFIEFAKKDIIEIKHRFLLSFDKLVSKIEPGKLSKLLELEGIDDIRPVGRYTFDILLARSFDVEKVIKDIENLVKDF